MTNGDVILKLVEMLLSEKEKAFELMKNDKKTPTTRIIHKKEDRSEILSSFFI